MGKDGDYLNCVAEYQYSQSTGITKQAYICRDCGKRRKFIILDVAFKTADVKCGACNKETTLPRCMFV